MPPSRPKAPGGGRLGAIETPLEDWQHVFQVNFFAPIMLARGLIAELERRQGRGGECHLHCRRPRASLCRRRLRHLEGSAGRPHPRDGGRFRPRGIRVNAISPGEIDTAILSPGTDKIVREQIPLRRLGEPEEVAKAIYFLCTEQSSYVNGAELHINGGQHV